MFREAKKEAVHADSPEIFISTGGYQPSSAKYLMVLTIWLV